jgi:hypothetical protein
MGPAAGEIGRVTERPGDQIIAVSEKQRLTTDPRITLMVKAALLNVEVWRRPGGFWTGHSPWKQNFYNQSGHELAKFDTKD